MLMLILGDLWKLARALDDEIFSRSSCLLGLRDYLDYDLRMDGFLGV